MGEGISSFEKDNTIEDASVLNDVLTKIENSNELIERTVDSKSIDVDYINEKLKERKKCKNNILTSIITCVLASSLAACLAPKEHNVIKTEYTTENDPVEEVLYSSDYKEDKKYILVYEPWKPYEDERIIKQYDVSDVELDSIEDYMNYDVRGLECESIPQKITQLKSKKDYNFEEIRKIVNIDYDEIGSASNSNVILSILSINLLLSFIDYFLRKDNYDFRGRFLSLSAMADNFWEYKRSYSRSGSDMKKVREILEKLKEPINEVLDEIEKNDELKNKFVKLFNENKYLLNDPEILFEKFNELIEKVNTPEIKKEYQELKLKSKKYID